MEDTSAQNTTATQPANNTSTFSYIDAYCERDHKPDIMAEPLNLFTNIAFIIGALLIVKMLRFYKQLTIKNWDILLLTTILAVIGFGSSAYHAMPDAITLNMDVLPITLFIHIFLLTFFIRVVGVNPIFAVVIMLLFFGSEMFFEKTFSRDVLNGTIMYVPTYLMLIIMVLVLGFVKQNPLYLHLINTAVIWTFSLAFRTMDIQICSYTHNIGTHFLWHLLNAIVLYRMLVLVIQDKLNRQSHVL